jgi:hypothetical protein
MTIAIDEIKSTPDFLHNTNCCVGKFIRNIWRGQCGRSREIEELGNYFYVQVRENT